MEMVIGVEALNVPVPQNHKCQTCTNIAQCIVLALITEVGRCLHSQIMFHVYNLAGRLACLDTERAFSLKTRRS